MKTEHDPGAAADAHVDRVARALHAEAVAHVPARTLRQLRAPRADTASARGVRGFGWMAAAACAAVFAVAIGLRQDPAASTSDQPAVIVATEAADGGQGNDAYADALASLDEDPGFYLWLASSDVQPLAME